jgi:tripartite-type tricarboxylate transporter receptor subunit TctC
VLAGGGAVELIRQGKLRPLATTGAERLPLFPDIAAVADLYPGYDLTNWAGIFAPVGTPQPIVSRLRAEIHRALAEAAVADKLRAIGPEPLILSAEEFAALVRRDYEKYGRLVKDIGLAIE